MRTDLLDAAITDLTNTAYADQTAPNLALKPSYRISFNSFDVAFNPLVPLTGNYVSAWSSQLSSMQANNTQFLEVYQNNQVCAATTSTSHRLRTERGMTDADELILFSWRSSERDGSSETDVGRP